MTHSIAFITGNAGKIAELRRVLAPEINVVGSALELIETQVLDVAQISRHKARQAFELTGQPVVVDDTGVYIEGYDRFPGVFAKFTFAQLGIEGMRKLVSKGTRGYFHTILSYMDANLAEPLMFEGKAYGRWDFGVAPDPAYASLPYDSFFYPDATNSAGLDSRVIDNFEAWVTEHGNRAQAAVKLKQFLLSQK